VVSGGIGVSGTPDDMLRSVLLSTLVDKLT
jgi:hypothetical protein